MNDQDRFQWLANFRCHELIVTRNGANACNYMTARQWIEERPEDFEEVSAKELERMKETDTIWAVQLYPKGSVSFYRTTAATLEAALDEMIEIMRCEYPNGVRPVE